MTKLEIFPKLNGRSQRRTAARVHSVAPANHSPSPHSSVNPPLPLEPAGPGAASGPSSGGDITPLCAVKTTGHFPSPLHTMILIGRRPRTLVPGGLALIGSMRAAGFRTRPLASRGPDQQVDETQNLWRSGAALLTGTRAVIAARVGVYRRSMLFYDARYKQPPCGDGVGTRVVQ